MSTKKRSRKHLVEETEKAMQHAEIRCWSCLGTGFSTYVGGNLKTKCGACGGTGVIRFRKKGLKLEPISSILEAHSVKKGNKVFKVEYEQPQETDQED